ncbi:HET-domain-containing protein [Cenococcum geophilum 1.58]|uniref:HET-domain-containing protein n=1 Tax=Cenococcum geophilum 1.58 TaxID=794803 RepID=UPI00358E3653|nr:HET-domain-containing protein [Cenococcum geophilum 1.58]
MPLAEGYHYSATSSRDLYQPLKGARDIRILILKHGCTDDILQCTLETVALDSEPQYEALSYVWGNESNQRPIIYNSIETTVTANLEEALVQLRDIEKDRTLWVDALCINQQDDFEKSLQVGIMDDIYRSAKLVLIWVGKADEETAQVWEMFSLIDRWHPGEMEDGEREKPEENQERAKKVWNFFARPWFNRAWTFQEAILARKSLMLCGDFSIDGQSFFNYTRHIDHLPDQWIQEIGPGWLSAFQTASYKATYQNSMKTVNTIPHCEHLLYFTQLSIVLQGVRQRNAKDARDKVFSLFGSFAQTFDPPLRPDYSLSVRDVFITAAALSLIADADLTVLSTIEPRHSSSELPSWVPDWRNPWVLSPLGYRRSDGRNVFSACGSTSPAIGFDSQNPHLLMVRGVFVVPVQQTIPIDIRLGDPSTTVSFNWPSDWPEEKVTTMKRIVDTTLAADLLPSGGRLTLQDELTTFPAYTAKCEGRSLFTSFQYIGLGPSTMQKGDIICILFGGRVPFVLRSRSGPVRESFDTDDGFTLVGECYVHGLMDGQTMQEVEKEQTIDFILW